jgi:hypothetical protein
VRRPPGRLGCAAEARERGEPILATASRVRRWLLVEQPGAWGRDAALESDLPAAVAGPLLERARLQGVRVLLVRDQRRDRDAPRSAFLVRSDRVHRWVERVTFDDPLDLLAIDLGSTRRDDPPGIGEEVRSSVFLVCTNGRHDPCCADFGRPVVRALREAGVEAWESSHVGGDRFAANVVCLPTGVYFGRVEPEEAAALLHDHDAGVLDLDHFRGRSCFPQPVQAAEILARQELGERGLHALRLDHWQWLDDQRAEVTFHHGEALVTVHVVRRPAPAAALTCSDDPRPTSHYELEAPISGS